MKITELIRKLEGIQEEHGGDVTGSIEAVSVVCESGDWWVELQ